MGNLDFNVEPPSEKELQGTYEDKLVPDGTYKVEVSETDFTPNSIGTGSYLRVDYTVLEGEHANEEFVEFFNIKHKNPDTEKWAKEDLSKLCRAVGIHGTLEDSEDLHGLELLVDLKIEVGKKDGVKRNVVKKYKPLPQAAPEPSAPASAPAPAQAQSEGSPPWQKR